MQDETVSRALYDAMRMALKDIEAVLARHGCPPGATMTDWVDEQLTALAAATKPVDMLLLCPNCGMQHIDAVETGTALSRSGLDTLTETEVVTWSNPPHRSHMCHSCGHQWRPADVATNGVAELKTKGKNDSPMTGPDRMKSSAPGLSDDVRAAVRDAVAQALGDAYDCTRVWEAWHVGTMSQDDFALVAEDDNRVAEIADAAIDALTSARAATVDEPSDQPKWRCFHCDETFNDAESAALHFGKSEMQSPACQIDIAEYRAMEQRMHRYNEEDTDLHREIHGLRAKHQVDLMREEEKGYARGLADGMKEAAQQQAEPGADEREREALAAFSMLYSACTTAMFAMGKDGANASVMHPMREAWEQCREAEQTAQKAMAKHRLFAAQSGQRAGVAEDAARYRRIRELWFEWGMHNINTPLGAALNALANVADRESLDAVLDSINAAPTQQETAQ